MFGWQCGQAWNDATSTEATPQGIWEIWAAKTSEDYLALVIDQDSGGQDAIAICPARGRHARVNLIARPSRT
ncbi:hypothetical protein [Rhodococcus opacus]|uniref:hypothetical protein n=1 Tax=Rhodococcus opacus TaxID=37919 RepID=UPI0029494C09|nr:hypothetical protein [Rhodococcus opacus]MDV6247197.1 hypothetical protein [Rhodococcus opacus]